MEKTILISIYDGGYISSVMVDGVIGDFKEFKDIKYPDVGSLLPSNDSYYLGEDCFTEEVKKAILSHFPNYTIIICDNGVITIL